MGRRELLIVVGFVVVGVAIYQLTAPAPTEGRRFSLGRLLDEIRADIRSDAESADYTHVGSIDVPPHLVELRVSSITGRIVVMGEDRADIEYELKVSSTGPDSATATEYAKRTALVQDDLGEMLWVRVEYPDDGRQTSEIVLRVPRRLGVRAEPGSSGGNTSEFRDLQAVRLLGMVGEVTAERIAGEVVGSHRNGRLTVTEAGSVSMMLTSSRALFSHVTGGLRLSATRGETRIVDSAGSTMIEQSSNEVHVERHHGPVRVDGLDGEITIADPDGEVRVDVRRAGVEVTLARAVPMTIITTDEPLRLVLDGDPAIVVEAAVAGGGSIDTEEAGLASPPAKDQTDFTHAFVDGATARVLLRNRRDDIVIRKTK